MALNGTRRGGRSEISAWPGWVDALSSLVLVIMFVLLVFILAQFYLTSALTGSNAALAKLNRQISELADQLSMERQSNTDLRSSLAQLSSELQQATAARDALSANLSAVQSERDALKSKLATLSAQGSANNADNQRVAKQLEDAFKVIDADRAKIQTSLAQIASLQADVKTLTEMRDRLEGQIAALSQAAEANKKSVDQAASDRKALLDQLGAARDRSKALEDQLASAQEKTMLAQKTIDQRDIRIGDLTTIIEANGMALKEANGKIASDQAELALLNQQMAALRSQLQALSAALDVSEQKDKSQQVQIADLGKRLNLALAGKVQELARYRSEFFGRLRQVLGNRPDIHIVGDRFVFQSEVLFPSGSADLQPSGTDKLTALAHTLLEIAPTIPKDVNWVLRINGYTDKRPIHTPQFPSNWELSTARAISVVNFLIGQGVPADRLAAAGFGANQPIDPGDSEAAYAKNRRIELQFDQR